MKPLLNYKIVFVWSLVLLFGSYISDGKTANSPTDSEQPMLPKLSVQLWSVKDAVKSDFKQTLEHLSSLGFQGVEFAGEFGPFKGHGKELRQYLNSLGLQGSGAHISFEQLNEISFEKTVSFYKAAGIELLIVAWDERAWHPDGIRDVVKDLNRLAKKLAPLSMKIGFHNHAHEFGKYRETTYWDYLATNTSQDVVLQLDVGWVVHAGKDPIEYVKRYPGRTLTTHYKVAPPDGSINRSPIIGGENQIDWLALYRSNIALGGTHWIVIEQEAYPRKLTPLQSLERSKKGFDKVIKNL